MEQKSVNAITVKDLGKYSRGTHAKRILNPFYIRARSSGPLNGTYAAKGILANKQLGINYYHDEDAILADARNLGKIYPNGVVVWPLSHPEYREFCKADKLMPTLLNISEKRAAAEQEKTSREMEEIQKKLNEPEPVGA